MISYWRDMLSASFEHLNITVTDEQLEQIADDINVAHECYGMAYGYDRIENPLLSKNKQLKAELQKEKSKRVCPKCLGSGEEITHGGTLTAISQCPRCHGEGKIL